jgi:hypothetical protein
VVATVGDYFEGWFDGDAERMERALHPAPAKTGIGVDVAGVRVMESMGAEDTIGWTRAPRYGTPTGRMEILSPAPGVAAALIAEVHELMVRRSVLRGQVLTMGGSDFEPGVGGITFHQRPTLASDDIVLPAGLLERLHRHPPWPSAPAGSIQPSRCRCPTGAPAACFWTPAPNDAFARVLHGY